MKVNSFTKPETLTDEQLDEIAAGHEQQKGALAERERRIEKRRVEAEEEARQKATAEERRQVEALLAQHAAVGAEAVRVNAAAGAAVIGVRCVFEKRDAVVEEVRRIAASLRSFGSPVPPLSLAFAPEVHVAARVVLGTIGSMVESPLASAERENPSAFFK